MIAKSKYIFYGPVQATSFSCKSYLFDENAQKPFIRNKIPYSPLETPKTHVV